MKKLMALLLLLSLLLPTLYACAEETVIINKIKDPQNSFTFPEDAKLLEIYIPKIYDSDANFIRYGEYTMLLDCAGEHWQRVADMLRLLEVTELTYAFASHPHTDHIGGFQHLLNDVKVENFVHAFPENYPYANRPAYKVYDAMHALEVPFILVGHGSTIEFGDVKMTIYQRDESEHSGNNNSAMMLLEYGERSMLFTADIQMAAQRLFVSDQAPIQADIMKYPHHGYNNMQQSFLKLVDPELVILTSGRNSANGLTVLKNNHVPFYFTQDSILRLTTDGKVWVLERVK